MTSAQTTRFNDGQTEILLAEMNRLPEGDPRRERLRARILSRNAKADSVSPATTICVLTIRSLPLAPMPKRDAMRSTATRPRWGRRS